MPRPPRSNPKTRTHAIELRKELTPAERKLWALIRNDQLGVNFRRQHAVGNYIPDFVCIEKKLIIELDGLPSVATFGTGRVRSRKNKIFGITGV
jgi:very-short-patch-repair endonuclease